MKKNVLLKVERLRKYFPVFAGLFRRQVANVKAVDDVSFTVHEGEVVCLVGESGCGKSTTGRAAIRLVEPTSGSLTFEGRDLCALSKEQLKRERRHMQMVFQDPYASLNPRKKVRESIGEALRFHNLATTEKAISESVIEILEKVGLPPSAADRYPHEFSGGQQQRICIGRALALQPKLIVCDEAVSALDVSVQAQILNLLRDLKQKSGLSYLFISHNLSTVRYLGDRVVVMYLGKVMESASVEALFAQPRHPYTQALLSATPKVHPQATTKRIILQGEVPSPINPPSGCPFRTRCPYAQPICAETPPRKKVFDPVTGIDDHTYDCIL